MAAAAVAGEARDLPSHLHPRIRDDLVPYRRKTEAPSLSEGDGWRCLPLRQSTALKDVESGFVVLEWDRAHVMNAFSEEVCADICDALEAVDADDRSTGLAMIGKEECPFFSAGYDLHDFQKIQSRLNVQGVGAAAAASSMRDLSVVRIFSCLRAFRKPLIALVNGHAVGMGVTILPYADLVISVKAATFHTPFVELSLVPEGGSSLLFPRLMGARRAHQMLVHGRKITAAEARGEYGLVDEIVDHRGLLIPTCFRFIYSVLGRQDAESFAAAKRLLWQCVDADLGRCFAVELGVFEQRLRSPQCKEKLESFLAKKARSKL